MPLQQNDAMRGLAAVTLTNTFGNGMFLTVGALYFTRVLGLSTAELALGLTAAGVFGIVAGWPMGRLADRVGPRRLLTWILAAQGVLVVGYTQATSFAVFLPVACAVTFADRGGVAVRTTLIGVSLPPERRVGGRAFLRVLTNIGMGAGTAVAAFALQADTRTAYTAVILLDAVTFLGAAVLLRRLPEPGPAPRPTRKASNPLADRPYMLITLLCGVLALQAGVLEVGLPLWIVRSTNAPRPAVAITLILNTVMVVFLQVRLSRGTEDPRRAARTCAVSGLALGAACLFYGGAQGLGPVLGTLMILIGGAAHTMGEMWSSTGGWSLSYELAPADAPGAYQGVFNSGFAAGALLAPAVVATTALDHGRAGWTILTFVFVITGLAVVPATRWALARTTVSEPGVVNPRRPATTPTGRAAPRSCGRRSSTPRRRA